MKSQSFKTCFNRLTSLHLILFAFIATGNSRSASGQAPAPKAGEFESETVNVANELREYRLFVPRSVDLATPAPLVVAFHGLMDTKDLMPKYTKLNETAEKHRFILVYPQAIEKSWGLAPKKVVDDLAFFDALLVKLETDYRIDPDRVYVLGISNGGYFAHVVARERSDTVAALASHSGPIGIHRRLGINADRKFPVMIIHGDRDRIFPIDIARKDRDQYEKEGHDVVYVEVPSLAHMWGTKVKINEQIWKFFSDHPREKQ